MNKQDKIFIALNALRLATNKVAILFKTFGSPEEVFETIKSSPESLKGILEENEIKELCSKLNEAFIDKVSKRLNDIGVFVITSFSDYIPYRLQNVFDMCNCFGLYFKGNIDILENKVCCIVGTRNPDTYGKTVTEMYAKDLARAGAVILSGLATGVDGLAHNTCLDNGGKTIAVLAGGFNHIYPTFHNELAEKIAKNGLLVSEYPPQIECQAFHFPIRNRLMAALSDAVVITEFSRKSGANHTKNYAIEYGVDLFVVVADITKESCGGNIDAISELPECASASTQNVLDSLKLKKNEVEVKTAVLTDNEQLIVDYLKKGEKHYNEIVIDTKLEPQRVNVLLTTLKIRGIIKQQAGNMYSL